MKVFAVLTLLLRLGVGNGFAPLISTGELYQQYQNQHPQKRVFGPSSARCRASQSTFLAIDIGERRSDHSCEKEDGKSGSDFPNLTQGVVLAYGLREEGVKAAQRIVEEDTLMRTIFHSLAQVLDASAYLDDTLDEVLESLHQKNTTTRDDFRASEGCENATPVAISTENVILPPLLLVLPHGHRNTHRKNIDDEGLAPLMIALDACDDIPMAIVTGPGSLASEDRGWPSQNQTLLEVWKDAVHRHSRRHRLMRPVKVHPTPWTPSIGGVSVAMNLELDGAWVDCSLCSRLMPGGRVRDEGEEQRQRWDTSKVKQTN
ncbi:unnamed protein product [Choristocarpus tenellus]